MSFIQTGCLVTDASSATADGLDTVNSLPLDAIGDGIVVGIGIICSVGGFLLGLLAYAAVRYLHRRKTDSFSIFRSGHLAFHPVQGEKCLEGSGQDVGDLGLKGCLPNGADDGTLVSLVATVADLVAVHTQVYYHIEPVGTDFEALTTSLVNLGIDESSAADLEGLALLPSTRRLAVRHVICWAIFSNLDLHSIGQYSLLPTPVLSFLRSASRDWDSLGTSVESRLALSYWRRLSAFLLHDQRQDKTPLCPGDNTRRPEVQSLVGALDEFLKYFAVSTSPGRRLEHLAEVIHKATKSGYVLFSHSCEWAFKLRVDSLPKEVMAVPGLERRSGYHNELLIPPVRVSPLRPAALGQVLEVEASLGCEERD
ncbi:hypothetical protein GQ53DRAFT_841837 [Thozetella sp. PMI_491]|nr:hypothetical protein GQ53DRAFT_841837 [Thozetella sp. PMI_491]